MLVKFEMEIDEKDFNKMWESTKGSGRFSIENMFAGREGIIHQINGTPIAFEHPIRGEAHIIVLPKD